MIARPPLCGNVPVHYTDAGEKAEVPENKMKCDARATLESGVCYGSSESSALLTSMISRDNPGVNPWRQIMGHPKHL
jgi:hypothetical protein